MVSGERLLRVARSLPMDEAEHGAKRRHHCSLLTFLHCVVFVSLPFTSSFEEKVRKAICLSRVTTPGGMSADQFCRETALAILTFAQPIRKLASYLLLPISFGKRRKISRGRVLFALVLGSLLRGPVGRRHQGEILLVAKPSHAVREVA
jgi:hypothetical protein